MSPFSESNLATAKTVLSTVGSIAATAMVVRGVSQDLLPSEFQEYVFSRFRNFFSRFSNNLTLVIDEFDGLVSNEIYEAAEIYLGPKVSPNTSRLKISRPEKEKHFNVTLERGEIVVDTYEGVKLTWIWICKKTESKDFYNPRDMNSTLKSEVRSFELTFHRKHKNFVIDTYLPYVANEAKNKKQENRTLKIFTLDVDNMYDISQMWTPITLDHPATFDTLAMDSKQKQMILNDLQRFVSRREYYRKVGKAWKRGYLLYGPPGTGKSSLIAAVANHMNYDVYDLELTDIRRNSELRRLLLGTANKSILVVEDIDCTIEFKDRVKNNDDSTNESNDQEESKVTLSGLLNFVDGLWSSIGDERIIIFTTNHIEKLDPALLRPGRMDVHVHMSYCTPCGFELLARNYLGIKDHAMFKEIGDLIRTANVSPAEVAEQLLKNDDPDLALQGLIDFIRSKIKENEKAETEKAQEEIAGNNKEIKVEKEENNKGNGEKAEEVKSV